MPHAHVNHDATWTDDWSALREDMVEHQLRRFGIRDQRVLAAMRKVPRHLFVPEELRSAAYDDTPLPLGRGQTISQPRMVAIMLQHAALRGHEHVLDVGAGSGYQAALLGELARDVIAIELLPDLAHRALRALHEAGSHNVSIVVGDGSVGYPPGAPFDAILVAAATEEIPPPLIEQLADGGRLLIPLGGRFGQRLTRVRKRDGVVTREVLEPCAFVPLVTR